MKTLPISDAVDLSRIDQTLKTEPISLAKEGKVVSVIISVEEFKIYQAMKQDPLQTKPRNSKVEEFLTIVKKANAHSTGVEVDEADYYKQYS